MDRLKLATVWLGGCSGCHMSFLDLDEWLIDLSGLVDLVYSPIADFKEFPEGVDLTLVEGAVANEDNRELLHKVRARSRLVLAFGDCAVTGNVTALRNPLGTALAVDYFLPGCPPPAPRIRAVLEALLRGETPVLEPADRKFG